MPLETVASTNYHKTLPVLGEPGGLSTVRKQDKPPCSFPVRLLIQVISRGNGQRLTVVQNVALLSLTALDHARGVAQNRYFWFAVAHRIHLLSFGIKHCLLHPVPLLVQVISRGNSQRLPVVQDVSHLGLARLDHACGVAEYCNF